MRYQLTKTFLRRFQHTAARRRLACYSLQLLMCFWFQHTAARRRLVVLTLTIAPAIAPFQHTAARRRLGSLPTPNWRLYCFNTQPPEGGWLGAIRNTSTQQSFNTQPPEGGWGYCPLHPQFGIGGFNTQPPEGGWKGNLLWLKIPMSFQHTAARRRLVSGYAAVKAQIDVSTHSRPKAAG